MVALVTYEGIPLAQPPNGSNFSVSILLEVRSSGYWDSWAWPCRSIFSLTLSWWSPRFTGNVCGGSLQVCLWRY